MQDKNIDLPNKKENQFLKKTILTRNIPIPKLIIKDHKRKNLGEYPPRLIVPVNNFTVGFPRLRYLGIRRIFDLNKVKYEEHTITQASLLKLELDKLEIRNTKTTIAKLDIVNMYPSIQFLLVKIL